MRTESLIMFADSTRRLMLRDSDTGCECDDLDKPDLTARGVEFRCHTSAFGAVVGARSLGEIGTDVDGRAVTASRGGISSP